MAQNRYGGIIWTHHALERLSQRGITQDAALRTFRDPDKSYEKEKGSTAYVKYFGEQKVTLIGKKTEQQEWIIVSAWIDPPLPGSVDEQRKKRYWEYKNASWWKKILIAFKQQAGF
jgi:hypothetical protein